MSRACMNTAPVNFADVAANKIADAMEALDKLPTGRSRSMTQTKLDEAMMWLDRARPAVNEEKSD